MKTNYSDIKDILQDPQHQRKEADKAYEKHSS